MVPFSELEHEQSAEDVYSVKLKHYEKECKKRFEETRHNTNTAFNIEIEKG